MTMDSLPTGVLDHPTPEFSSEPAEVQDLIAEVIDSPTALHCIIRRWDKLVQRSYSNVATCAVRGMSDWLEFFAPNATFSAIVVHRGGELVGGLPLISRRVGKFLAAGTLPSNEWAPAGDLLIDRNEDATEVSRAIVQGLKQTPWSLFWLDEIEGHRPDWLALTTALTAEHFPHSYHERFQVGRIGMDHELPFESVRKKWSKNHRRSMDRSIRTLKEQGELKLAFHAPQSEAEALELCDRGFTVEDLGWKGEQGTSILKTPGMHDFFHRQALHLFSTSQLRIAFLEFKGEPIAFEYGWVRDNEFYSYKVGYDPAYAKYSPGQLLIYELMNHFREDGVISVIDCLGPMSDAVRRWRPETYSVGRLVTGTGVWGKTLVTGYRDLWRRLRK